MTTFEEFTRLEADYVQTVRDSISTLDMETLDRLRRLGERVGDEVLLADMTGDELADLCDTEIAGRRAGPCEKCGGSGEYAVRNTWPMTYVAPGPVPEDAPFVAVQCDCK